MLRNNDLFGMTALGMAIKAAKNFSEKSDASADKQENNDAKREPKAGDILSIERCGGLYSHFAVYIGNDEVIHYNGAPDNPLEVVIRQSPMKDFLRGQNEFYILDFPEKYDDPDYLRYIYTKSSRNSVAPNIFPNGIPSYAQIKAIVDFFKSINYHLYTPEETVSRAKSRLGENKYSISMNNCEYFAIWCKTGISESRQVNRVLDFMGSAYDIKKVY